MSNLAHALMTMATAAPARACLTDDTGRWTWGDVADDTSSIAAGLARHGVRAGDVVAIQLPNCADLILVMLAAWRIGAAVTPLNPRLTETESTHQVVDSGARVVVSVDASRTFGSAAGVTPEDLRGSARLAAIDEATHGLALLIYTSGTTGEPKGVMIDHDNLAAMTSGFIAWFGLTDADHSLVVLPLFHANGIVLGSLSPLLAGGQISIVGQFSKERFFSDVERHRPTYFSAVPAIYAMLSDLPATAPQGTGSLRFAICGAAPMPPELIHRFEARYGIPVVEGYGLSETTCAVTINPVSGLRKPGTVGVPLPGQQLRIIDESGATAPAGERGEVCVAGANVMRGYLRRPEQSAEVLRDGWLRTGDVGYLDEDGYLVLVDRIKDMIIRGGENVYPQEIERALHEHPDVLECAVVGRRHAVLGEVPVAFVVLGSGSTVTEDQLADALTARLSAYKLPVALSIVPSLPKNPVGKIDKRSLRVDAAVAS